MNESAAHHRSIPRIAIAADVNALLKSAAEDGWLEWRDPEGQ